MTTAITPVEYVNNEEGSSKLVRIVTPYISISLKKRKKNKNGITTHYSTSSAKF